MNLAEGRARIEAVVDDTVKAVLPSDVETTVEGGDPGYCTDDTSTVGYERQFSLGDTDVETLFEDVTAYWKERGFATNTRNEGSDVPALFADDDGFSYSLQINRTDERAWIGGGTPCLDNE